MAKRESKKGKLVKIKLSEHAMRVVESHRAHLQESVDVVMGESGKRVSLDVAAEDLVMRAHEAKPLLERQRLKRLVEDLEQVERRAREEDHAERVRENDLARAARDLALRKAKEASEIAETEGREKWLETGKTWNEERSGETLGEILDRVKEHDRRHDLARETMGDEYLVRMLDAQAAERRADESAKQRAGENAETLREIGHDFKRAVEHANEVHDARERADRLEDRTLCG